MYPKSHLSLKFPKSPLTRLNLRYHLFLMNRLFLTNP
jgi:hypothetical protein